MVNTYDIIFYRGPLHGKVKAYPKDPGSRLSFPCEDGGEVVYQRDDSGAAAAILQELARKYVYKFVEGDQP